MLKACLYLFVCTAFSIDCAAQAVLLPAPINSSADEGNPVMLPDSSIMLSSNREGHAMFWKCYRFEFLDGKWQQSPSHLDSLINSLIIGNTIPSFRFSNDFTRIMLTLYLGDKPTRFSESQQVNGRWNLFHEILNGNQHNLWHGLSITDDGTKLFATTRKGILYSFKRTGNDWNAGEPITTFDHVLSEFQQPIVIGDDGLLFNARYTNNKGQDTEGFFFAKQLADGTWTAPVLVENIYGLDVALATSFKKFLFCGRPDQKDFEVAIMKIPRFLQMQIDRSEPLLVNNPTSPTREISSTPSFVKPVGQYYALLIGNSDYQQDALDLSKPSQDVQLLYNALTSRYEFPKENINVLYNADRNSTFRALYELRTRITPVDNLLIFYAGHGFWDNRIKQGYWWPVDASPDNPSNWLSNSDLVEQIRGIHSAHTLLISDACFSGGIFKTRGAEELQKAGLDIQQLYRMPSRRAITSGTLNTVPDESVFFKYLVKYLNENQEKFISSQDIFTAIRRAVMSNSLTTPQDGVIMNTGDEGGDFIFIVKD